MKNIIMCGGSGTRLWPISRTRLPKQFCDLGLENTLFQMSVLRNKGITDEVIVVTNNLQKHHVINQMADIDTSSYRLLLEPVGRNTAPAIILACLVLDKDDIVLISASDHLIKDVDGYKKACEKAEELAKQGNIVTFGVNASSPKTGYGYIEADGNDVISFKEKPDLETAKEYLKKGNYYWNSGMFVAKVETILDDAKKYAPKILEKCILALPEQSAEMLIDKEKMLDIPADSIDYAVIENSDRVKVVPIDVGWSDLGDYDSLYDNFDKDADNNVCVGDGILSINSKNNLIMNGNKVIVAIDVEDLIITETKDALLISKMGSSSKIKQAIPKLEEMKKGITSEH